MLKKLQKLLKKEKMAKINIKIGDALGDSITPFSW